MRQNPGVNAIATKMYEEKLKVPLPRDSLDDAAMKVHHAFFFFFRRCFIYF